jgi:ammonium transporter, Amt family
MLRETAIREASAQPAIGGAARRVLPRLRDVRNAETGHRPHTEGTSVEDVVTLSSGDTAWLLVSSALVLLMTPGLAFFYGGLNRSKSVLNMMMMSFSAIGLISILWLLYGFSGAFGVDQPLAGAGTDSVTHGFLGDLGQYLGTKDLSGSFAFPPFPATPIPTYVIMAFQMMFAIITVALISGGISDRTKFIGWLLFAAGWFTLAYVPIAHMVWGGGLIGGTIGALDFAGGSAVHINAGAAALALAIVLGRRVGWPRENFKPHNVPFVALGAGLLWFGWFGFNAGSELTADGITALAFVNTQIATAAALLGWILVEWIRNGKPTLVGASSGAVAGLVAITPACAYILPVPAALLGLIAGAVCCLAVSLKYRLRVDDSLDVFGIHFIGGWIGCLFIGFFGTTGADALSSTAADAEPFTYVVHPGLFYGGGFTQLIAQAEGAAIVTVWSFTVALVIGLVLKAVGLLKLKEEHEVEGIDVHQHKESAYDTFSGGHSEGGAGAHAAVKPAVPAGV